MGSTEPKRMRAVIKDPQHCSRVAESLQDFKEKVDLMDVSFVCARGQTVYAHKLLLCSVSMQMKKMFLELPDNIDNITVHLPDIKARILKNLLDFLYEGKLILHCKSDYAELNELMELLEVVFLRSSSNKATTTLVPENQVPPTSQTQQPVQPQPLYYMQPSGLNNQGQMQYMVATQGSLPQGQMMQMPQAAASGQILQVGQPQVQVAQAQATNQVMQVAATTTSMPQGQMMQIPQAAASGQILQMGQPQVQVAQSSATHQVMQVAAPTTSMPQGQMVQMAQAIMTQTGVQMVQAGSTALNTGVQQNNMVQMGSSNNAQVVPMVAGNQMVQCSSQMVVQGSQATMVNNNHLQGNIQNQVARPTQRPQQYVMASSDNQMTTSRRRTQTQTQYSQPEVTQQNRIVARARPTAQVALPTRNSTINNAGGFTKIILEALTENFKENNEGIESLSAKQLREILEPKLKMNLSSEESLIEQLLESFKNGENINGKTAPTCERLDPTPSPTTKRRRGSEKLVVAPATNRRRRRRSATLSNNEDDEKSRPEKSCRKV